MKAVGIGFDRQAELDRLRTQLSLSFPLLADSDREWYRAFDVPRGSWRSVLAPRILARYARALRHRERMFRPRGDVRQLGAGVLLCGRHVVATWISAESERRPTVQEVLEAAHRAPGVAP